MNFENIHIDDLRFIDESPWLIRWSYWWVQLFQKLMRITPILAPVIYKGWKGNWTSVSIDTLAKALGITDLQASTLIGLHKRRLRQRTLAITVVYLPLTVPAIFAPLLFFFWHKETMLGLTSEGFLWVFGILGVIFVSAFIYIPAVVKFSATLVDKHYADSLCVLTALFVLCEMTRDDVLLHPGRRRSLLHRIDTLGRLTRLLGVTFQGGSESTRGWSWKHFQKLELYVRESEQAIIAPTQSTLANLRKKMAALIELYLFGHYGDNVWNGNAPDLERIQETEANRRVDRLQLIMGPTIPGALLIIIGVYPDFANSIGIETKALFLIFVTWFILALDASLGLGVIEKVVKTAKELRELK